MRVGDRVRHKLCGLTMTIKKLSESVATCHRDEPWYWKYDTDPHYTAICAIENLEVIQEVQPTLFEPA